MILPEEGLSTNVTRLCSLSIFGYVLCLKKFINLINIVEVRSFEVIKNRHKKRNTTDKCRTIKEFVASKSQNKK